MTLTRAELDEFLEHLTDDGHPAPCRVHPRAGWVAEDHAAQRNAAALCAACPALTQCRDYGTANPREFGVYGGLTDPERQPRRGRPAKEIAP